MTAAAPIWARHHRYFHFRWRLHDSLQYESVSGKDRWQYAVDAVLADVNDAFTDKVLLQTLAVGTAFHSSFHSIPFARARR